MNSSEMPQFQERLREYLAPSFLERLNTPDASISASEMAAECARLRAELSAIAAYVPSMVLREQLQDPTPGRVRGEYWDGTVLFADLSGFTALSGTLSKLGKQGAEETSQIINTLFSAMLEELSRHHGVLLKFGGDAITAFFDAATLHDEHAQLACQAALAMQQRMNEFSSIESRAGEFQLRLRIGVHSGRVFAAQVGSLEHIELVVTGRNINRVALAQELAEPGEVLISSQTHQLIGESQCEPRQNGFFLLSHLVAVEPSTPQHSFDFTQGPGDYDELMRLVQQLSALRPLLPRNLPRRYLTNRTPSSEIGEFRTVTMVFANFLPFSQALDIIGDDADLAAQVLNAYYRRAQAVIHHYDGIVNKVDMYTHGDKLMALFGAPVMHEDDTMRAIRAAIDLDQALQEANAEVSQLLAPWKHIFSINPQFYTQHIGINNGVVFAGTVGSFERHEYTVIGQAVNLAARLMSKAEENRILISPAVARQVERYVELEQLTPMWFKGVSEPVPVSQILHLRNVDQGSSKIIDRAELIGRNNELQTLIDEGSIALKGAGRVIVLVGDAGVGKTRLTEEMLMNLVYKSGRQDLPSFFPYLSECQSYNQNTPYSVVRDILRQFFHLGTNELTTELNKIIRRVQILAPQLARFTPLLGDILGLPFDDTPLTSALTPEQRHDRVQDLVEALLLSEAQRQPLMIILDDMHWSDASSLDMLSRLARAAAQSALLIVLSYRFDQPFEEPWRDFEHCVRIELRELSASDSTALVESAIHGSIPQGLQALIDKAQGNPFFIEEVMRELIETGALVQTENGWQLTEGLDETTIPGSIEGIITARLDRLEEQYREVIQVASVIGRRFQYPILSDMVPNGDLINRLNWLTASDLIVPDMNELAYLFKHALTRDVTYESILYARRRELHRGLARLLERLYAERLDEQLSLLAHHTLLAEEWNHAFDYHLRAGRQAQSRYANLEAISFFERALDISSRISDAEWLRLEREVYGMQSPLIEVNERLGTIYSLTGKYDQALSQYQIALAQLNQSTPNAINDAVRLHHHTARVYEKRADFDTAFEWLEKAMALAGNHDSVEIARCWLLGAGLHRRQGRYAQSIEWGERALAMGEHLNTRYIQAAAYKLLGGTYRNMGNNAKALDLTSRCIEIYQQIQDLVGLADAHNDLANIYCDIGRLSAARPHYEIGAEIKQTIGDVYGQAMIANNLGDLLRLQDNLSEAIEQYEHSLKIFDQLGSLYASGVLHMNLGATHLLQEHTDLAEHHLKLSLELFEQAAAEDFLPELHRYFAELYMQRKDLDASLEACEISLAHAARLEARAEEGATRRTLSMILASSRALDLAWVEINQSLELLREAASPHEIAKSLVYQANIASELQRFELGQKALEEALPILIEVGAQRDIEAAQVLIAKYGYHMP